MNNSKYSIIAFVKKCVGEKLESHKGFHRVIVFVKADLKPNKELMKSSVPNNMTGLVSETSDLGMTFQAATFYLERISSKPPRVRADPWHKVRRKERMREGN